MPRMIGIKVKPKFSEAGKKGVVKEGNSPPTRGAGGDWFFVLPLEGVYAMRKVILAGDLEGAKGECFVVFLCVEVVA